MNNKFKNHVYTNFLALAGYPLMWYINTSINYIHSAPLTIYGTKSLHGFWFITSFFFCPYMFLTFLIALVLFIIGCIYKKIRNIEQQEKNNNIVYNIFFNIGFSIYLIFSVFFFVYVCFCVIKDFLV